MSINQEDPSKFNIFPTS